jgi:hypothetical protein
MDNLLSNIKEALQQPTRKLYVAIIDYTKVVDQLNKSKLHNNLNKQTNGALQGPLFSMQWQTDVPEALHEEKTKIYSTYMLKIRYSTQPHHITAVFIQCNQMDGNEQTPAKQTKTRNNDIS